MSSKQMHGWKPEARRIEWPAIVLQIAAATVLSGAIAYLATSGPKQSVAAETAPVVAALPHQIPAHPIPAALPVVPVKDEPVRFTNPFDATEVFQFPAGTSESDARQAVAGVLLQRARDRNDFASKAAHAAPTPTRSHNVGARLARTN